MKRFEIKALIVVFICFAIFAFPVMVRAGVSDLEKDKLPDLSPTPPPKTVTPTPPPPPPPPPPKSDKKKVYLSGSRYWNHPTVGKYMQEYTASKDSGAPWDWAAYYGYSSFSDFLNKTKNKMTNDTYKEITDFIDKVYNWPASAGVFSQQQQQNQTSIVDEDGNILGTITTSSYLGKIPGMTYLGDPCGYGGYNQAYAGPGSLTFDGVDYEVVAFVSISPIVIDLDSSGTIDVDNNEWRPHPSRFNKDAARMFDMDGDGDKDLVEWLGPNDGLLVAPMEDLGVDGGRQLFGTAVGFVDGYMKLSLIKDTNHDGQVSGDELNGLMVWVDSNQDAICQPEELTSVQEMGITSISTDHENFKSVCEMNGKTTTTWDWWPTMMVVKPAR